MGAGVAEDGLVGEAAEVVLVAGVQEGDEVALQPEELALTEPFLAGVGGARWDGDRGVGGLTVVAHLVVGLLVVGVDGLAERDILLLMVAFVRSLGMNLGGRLSFGSFALIRNVRLGKVGLRRVDQCCSGGGLLLIMSADLLPQVVVELLEADLLVVEPLGVDSTEVVRLSIGEVLHIVSGEINAGGQLAIVLFFGLLDEDRGVGLDGRELLGGQLARQEAGR